MPPHCDSLDGPVVAAARQALEEGDVDLVLPFVPQDDEAEVRSVFESVMQVRTLGADARHLADRHLFETVVRLHRLGEGAPYTGLRPAGTPTGPVVPLAEKAVASGDAAELEAFLVGELSGHVDSRLAEVQRLAVARGRSVVDARAYVEAMLGFEVYCHGILLALRATAHSEEPQHRAAHSHG